MNINEFQRLPFIKWSKLSLYVSLHLLGYYISQNLYVFLQLSGCSEKSFVKIDIL